jgi:hypothetical protein
MARLRSRLLLVAPVISLALSVVIDARRWF